MKDKEEKKGRPRELRGQGTNERRTRKEGIQEGRSRTEETNGKEGRTVIQGGNKKERNKRMKVQMNDSKERRTGRKYIYRICIHKQYKSVCISVCIFI
jgi:hypothetical protein